MLIVSPCTPDPDGVGWEQRIYSQLVAISYIGKIELWFTPSEDSPCLKRLDKLKDICISIRVFYHQALQHDRFLSRQFQRAINASDILYVFRFAELLFRIDHPQIVWDIDELPIELRSPERLSESERSYVENTMLADQNRLTYTANRKKSRKVFASSIRETHDDFKIDQVLPNIARIQPFRKSEGKNPYLLFVGNLNKVENLEALIFTFNHLLPLLPKSVQLKIVGRTPVWRFATKAIDELQKQQNVEWFFDVESCTPFYTPDTIVLVPLLSGAGTKLKLLEALAHGCSVVASLKALEGLDLRHQRDLMIGNSASELAQHVLSLIENKDLRNRIRRSGFSVVNEQYSQDVVNRIISTSLSEIIASTNR